MSRVTTKFGDYAVHVEWQHSKRHNCPVRQVKKDRKLRGELRKVDGKVDFWLFKRAEDFVFCKEAIDIDVAMGSLLLCLGKPDIVIAVSNGDIYRISYESFVALRYRKPDPKLVSRWFVPVEHFAFEQGEPETIEESMKIGKWK